MAKEVLEKRVEGIEGISQSLKEERYGTPMAVTYEEKNKPQCAVGIFFEVVGNHIDFRTHTEQVLNLSQVPDNYTVLKILIESISGYKVLAPLKSVSKKS